MIWVLLVWSAPGAIALVHREYVWRREYGVVDLPYWIEALGGVLIGWVAVYHAIKFWGRP